MGLQFLYDGYFAGTVGIGTDSPDNILEVFAPGNGDGILIQSDPAGVDRAPALHLNPTAVSANGRNWALSPYRDLPQSLSFSSSNAKGGDAYAVATTRMIIDGISGNVGIGVTAPQQKLTLGSVSAGGIQFNYDSTDNYRHQILNYWNSSTDSRMDFNIARSSGQTPETILSVGYGGNVGIGTITPGAKLEVAGNTRLGSGTFHVSSDATLITSATYTFRDGVYINNPNSTSAAVASGNVMSIGASSGNTVFTSLITTGAIGIGKSNPSAQLDVVGTGNFTGLVSGITPVNAANFVTKAYVDGSGGGTGPFLPLAGGTLTGSLGINGSPTTNYPLTLRSKSGDYTKILDWGTDVGGSWGTLQIAQSAPYATELRSGAWNFAQGNVGIGRSPVAYGSFKVLDLAGSSGAIQKLIHTGNSVELQAFASSSVGAIGTATSHSLLITTADVTAITIDTSQNSTFAGDVTLSLGSLNVIGANSVNTVGRFESGVGSTNSYLQLLPNGATDTNSGYIGYDTSNLLKFYTQNTLALYLNSSQNATFAGTIAVQGTGDSYFTGNVGIGITSNINAPLTIQANSGGTSVNLVARTTGQTSTIRFYNDDATTQTAWIGGSNTDFNINSISALPITFNTDSTQRMVISSAGAIRFNDYGAGTLVTDASGNITVSSGGGAGGPYLPLAGGTMTGNTTNTPGTEVRFGSSNEFGLFYSSGVSNIRINSGQLDIRADNLNLCNQDKSENYLTGVNAGAVSLYCAGIAKLNTMTTGIVVGPAPASTNLELNLNGVANKAIRIQFQESGTNRWLLGQGAASENSDFELYNSAGVITISANRSTNAVAFAGSVGIGTATLGNKLDVLGGDIRVSNAASTTDVKINNSTTGLVNSDLHLAVTNSGEGQVRMYGNYPLTFYTNNTEKLRIDSNGNVGINVVAQNSSATWRNFQLGGGNVVTRASTGNGMLLGTGFIFTSADTELYKNTAATSRVYFNNDEIRFQNAASGTAGSAITWNETMRIIANGNVGIGNTGPTSQLQVGPGTTNASRSSIASLGGTGSSILNALSLVNTAGAAADEQGVSVNFHLSSNYSPTGVIEVVTEDLTANATNSSMRFRTYGTHSGVTTLNPRMTISSAGAIRFNDYDSTNKTGTPTYLLGTDASGNVVKTLSSSAPGSLWAASGNDIYNTNSADVGIGITNPSGKFHVYSGLAHNNIYFNTGFTGGTGYDVNLYLNGGANNSEMSINMGIVGNEDRDRIKTYQGNMYFRTNDAERMIIDSSGFTSIKTADSNGASQITPTLSLSFDGGSDVDYNIGYLNFLSNDASTTSSGGVGGIGVYAETAFNTSYTPSYMSFYTHDTTTNDGTTLGNVTERMRITSSGQVNIATPITNAFYGLSLQYNSLDTAEFKVNQATGQIKIGGVATGYFPTFYSAGSEKMRIQTNGNVGIGSTVSSDINDGKLLVNGTLVLDQTSEIKYGKNNGGPYLNVRSLDTSTSACGIRIHSPFGSPGYLYGEGAGTAGIIAILDGAGQGVFSATQGVSTSLGVNNSTRLFINNSGNVGIGTTTPQKKVHIEGTGGASEMQILVSGASDTVGHTAGIGLRAEGGEADSDVRIKGGIFFERIAGSFGNGKMILAVNSSVSNTSVTVADHALTIDTNKNVGIGTTSPATALDVVGSISTDDLFMTSTAAGGAGTLFVVNEATQLVTRTAAQVLSDIGAAPAGPGGVGYLPLSAGSSYPLTGDLYLKTATNEGNLFFGTASASYKIFGGGTYGYMGYDTGGYHRFLVSGSEEMRITSGNLIFNGSANILSNTSDGADNAQIIISGGGSTTAADTRGASIHLAGNENGNGGLLQLRAGDGTVGGIRMYEGGSERVRLYANVLTTTGNVGIGVTSTSGRLHVGEDNGPTALYMTNTDTAQTGAGDVQNRIIMKGLYYSGANSQLIETRINSVHQLADGNGGSALTFMTQTGGNGVVEQVRIDRDGNVGIGTTSPVKKLVLDKSNSGGAGAYVRVQNEVGGVGANVGVDFATFSPEFYSATSLDPTAQIRATDISNYSGRLDILVRGQGTAGVLSTVATFDRSGNVGIGTTSPYAKLSVKDGTNINLGIKVGQTDATAVMLNAYNDAVNANIPMEFRASKFNFDVGNVGIGTTVPSYALDIERVTGEVAIQLQARDNSSNTAIYFGDNDDADVGSLIYNQGSNYMSFTTNTGERMRINSSGDVGIGIDSTSAKLNVKGALSLWDAAAVSAITRFNPSGDSYINGGDVGIGNTIPQRKLDVSGSIRGTQYNLSGNVTNPTTTAATIYDQSTVGLTLSAHNIELRNYNGSAMARSVFFTHNTATFTGTCTATNFILSSDETLKDNIKEIESKHIDVNWKNFELKSEPGVKRSGVIAQELEKKHPEFVRTDDEGLKSVAYIDLLISKIAELEARLEKAGI